MGLELIPCLEQLKSGRNSSLSTSFSLSIDMDLPRCGIVADGARQLQLIRIVRRSSNFLVMAKQGIDRLPHGGVIVATVFCISEFEEVSFSARGHGGCVHGAGS